MVESKVSGIVMRPSPSCVNGAGSITNIGFGPFGSVALIRSMAGTHRSRHYHSTDEHILFVLEGRMAYWERELDGEYPAEPTWVEAGESIFTPALVAHQTFFPVNTVLISMSKNERNHEAHEADVVRVEEPWLSAKI